MGVNRRRGRWKSLTPRQYLWHDATALNMLSEAVVKSNGFPKCLRVINAKTKGAPFHNDSKPWRNPARKKPTMGDCAFSTEGALRRRKFRIRLRNGIDSAPAVFSASDLHASTAAPTDNQNVFRGTIPIPHKKSLARRGVSTKKEISPKLNCFLARTVYPPDRR